MAAIWPMTTASALASATRSLDAGCDVIHRAKVSQHIVFTFLKD
jgi:hypothetical protein